MCGRDFKLKGFNRPTTSESDTVLSKGLDEKMRLKHLFSKELILLSSKLDLLLTTDLALFPHAQCLFIVRVSSQSVINPLTL